MAWLFLGLIALPLAAALYVGFEWAAPRLLEPETEAAPATPRRSSVSGFGLGRRSSTAWRAGVLVVVLALLGFAFARQRSSTASQPAPVAARAPAPPLQLPAPAALEAPRRLGGDGSGAGQLHDPRDLAADPVGNVYVADTGNHRIVKFKPDGSVAGQWSASARGAMVEPSALAVVKDGVVVLDSATGQLHKFDFDGTPVASFERDLGLTHARGITVDAQGTLLVADTAGNRLVKIAPDGSGAGDVTGLNQPASVAVDPRGTLYVAEPDAKELDALNPAGTRLARWALPGASTVLPPHLLWMPGRGLLATAPNQNMVLQYGPDGAIVASWAPLPAEGIGPPAHPLGLTLAPGGTSIWVVWDASSSATLLQFPS